MTKQHTRQSITHEERYQLQQYKERNKSATQEQCAEWFNKTYGKKISQSTVSDSLNSRRHRTNLINEIRNPSRSRDGKPKWPKLETPLYERANYELKNGRPVTKPLLAKWATELFPTLYPEITAVPSFSIGMMSRFADRNGIVTTPSKDKTSSLSGSSSSSSISRRRLPSANSPTISISPISSTSSTPASTTPTTPIHPPSSFSDNKDFFPMAQAAQAQAQAAAAFLDQQQGLSQNIRSHHHKHLSHPSAHSSTPPQPLQGFAPPTSTNTIIHHGPPGTYDGNGNMIGAHGFPGGATAGGPSTASTSSNPAGPSSSTTTTSTTYLPSTASSGQVSPLSPIYTTSYQQYAVSAAAAGPDSARYGHHHNHYSQQAPQQQQHNFQQNYTHYNPNQHALIDANSLQSPRQFTSLPSSSTTSLASSTPSSSSSSRTPISADGQMLFPAQYPGQAFIKCEDGSQSYDYSQQQQHQQYSNRQQQQQYAQSSSSSSASQQQHPQQQIYQYPATTVTNSGASPMVQGFISNPSMRSIHGSSHPGAAGTSAGSTTGGNTFMTPLSGGGHQQYQSYAPHQIPPQHQQQQQQHGQNHLPGLPGPMIMTGGSGGANSQHGSGSGMNLGPVPVQHYASSHHYGHQGYPPSQKNTAVLVPGNGNNPGQATAAMLTHGSTKKH